MLFVSQVYGATQPVVGKQEVHQVLFVNVSIFFSLIILSNAKHLLQTLLLMSIANSWPSVLRFQILISKRLQFFIYIILPILILSVYCPLLDKNLDFYVSNRDDMLESVLQKRSNNIVVLYIKIETKAFFQLLLAHKTAYNFSSAGLWWLSNAVHCLQDNLICVLYVTVFSLTVIFNSIK